LILLPWERCKALVRAISLANWALVLGEKGSAHKI
jgi:hypothetical protein